MQQTIEGVTENGTDRPSRFVGFAGTPAYPDKKQREPVAPPPPPVEAPGLRLNLGSGDVPLDGWTNLDLTNGADCRNLDVPDDSCDEIRASHVLEHLVLSDIIPTLAHWRSKLKTGGNLSIAVPDLQKIGAELASQQIGTHTLNCLFGGQTTPNDFHHCGFTERILVECLRRVGFVAPRRWFSHVQDCAALPVSLNIRATKGPFHLSDVVLGMTVPRLGFVETHQSLQHIGAQLGLSLFKAQGVFWHHGLTRVFNGAIQQSKVPYVLTVDYDSVFTPGDVMMLYDAIVEQNLDAVFAVQVGREMQNILTTMNDEQGNLRKLVPEEELRGQVIAARTGHFGLTILRTDKIAALPKPWFAEQVDKNGEFGDERIDCDVNFWLKWKAAGHSLGMVPGCVIGHQQLMVTWPDKAMSARHQYLGEYAKSGKPEWAW